ncbi:hypothetical protein D3C84_1279920 [compost metagenome]
MSLTYGTGSDGIISDNSLNIGAGGAVKLTVTAAGFIIPTIPVHVDNNAAITGGVPVGGMYKTSAGEVRVRV